MGKSQNFEELETPHIIIVEDKTIKWLISDLIKKINGNYNIIEKNENIDYVKNDKKNIYCCCIYTLKVAFYSVIFGTGRPNHDNGNSLNL